MPANGKNQKKIDKLTSQIKQKTNKIGIYDARAQERIFALMKQRIELGWSNSSLPPETLEKLKKSGDALKTALESDYNRSPKFMKVRDWNSEMLKIIETAQAEAAAAELKVLYEERGRLNEESAFLDKIDQTLMALR